LEWRLVKVVKSASEATDDGLNYYIKDTHKLVFNEYKTKAKYGKQVFALRKGSPLETILTARPEGLLFHDEKGDAYDAKAFSKKVKRDTGISVNDFRHSYITHFLKSAPSVASKLETAEMMAHAIGTQAKYQKDDESSSSDSE
jgi:integrase